ncbi:efflux RND transporter periplasmic adaptor subunit [Brachybacterium sp. J144]|uniref:efflux RND transporter periplasmic adaptor subunit n=1 Tax=Brachybacterium sp. J144 TaxID=3116487 RepID=UPI002E7931E2|nr:efflux RND transporter periplasmic adaptor subunit [Brachybacterium sp. J144]MEE1650118.1 efflux RND transporter periplasmic adaptor subunit [Brachybacterium sp. J144]
MNVLRRYVFPVIWMLILGIIALALAKMAFFPSGQEQAEDPLTPSAEFDQFALVPVTRGDISSELVLDALVQPDPGTALTATAAGEITKIWADEGDAVSEGDRVLQVRVPVEPDPIEMPVVPSSTEDGGESVEEQAAPFASGSGEQEYRYVNLRATADGVLRDMDLEEWDGLELKQEVATISPGTYSIVADLTPEQQLSLLDVDIAATATLSSSVDPITCETPAIDEDSEVEEPGQPQIDPMTGEEIPAEVSAARLECAVPEGTRIVAGLEGEIRVDLGSRAGVLTVPTTAVQGEAEAGTVYVLDEATGEPTPVTVGLGLRGDGIVEVTEGLEEGQEILQFVPGVDAPEDEMVEMW